MGRLLGDITFSGLREKEKGKDDCGVLGRRLNRTEDERADLKRRRDEKCPAGAESCDAAGIQKQLDAKDEEIVRLKARRQEQECDAATDADADAESPPREEPQEQEQPLQRGPETCTDKVEAAPQDPFISAPDAFVFPENRRIPQQRPPAGSCGLRGLSARSEGGLCSSPDARAVSVGVGAPAAAAVPPEPSAERPDTRFPVAVLGAHGVQYVRDPEFHASRALGERVREKREETAAAAASPLVPRRLRWISRHAWALALAAYGAFLVGLLIVEKLPAAWVVRLRSKALELATVRGSQKSVALSSALREMNRPFLLWHKCGLSELMMAQPLVLLLIPFFRPNQTLAVLTLGALPLAAAAAVRTATEKGRLAVHLRRAATWLRRRMTETDWLRPHLYLVPSPSTVATYAPVILFFATAFVVPYAFRRILRKFRPVWDKWLFDAVTPASSTAVWAATGATGFAISVLNDVVPRAPAPPQEGGQEKDGGRERKPDAASRAHAARRKHLVFLATSVAFFVSMYVALPILFPTLRKYDHRERLDEIARFVVDERGRPPTSMTTKA